MARHNIHTSTNILFRSLSPLVFSESGILFPISSPIIFSSNRKFTIPKNYSLVLGNIIFSIILNPKIIWKNSKQTES